MSSIKNLFSVTVVGLLSLSSCSKDNPSSSDTNGACNPAAAVRRNAFTIDGNGYSNIILNLDTIGSSQSTILRSTGSVYTYDKLIFSLTLNNDTVGLLLHLRFPSISSGSYSWADRSRDTSAMGCSVVLYHLDGSIFHSYNSVSGGTNMKLFQTNPVAWDSMFSSYCGTLKDSLGNTITLTNGTFYISHS